jgi:Putative transcriptional repressor regulating G2/M transition
MEITDTQDTTLDSPEERRRRFLIEFERPFKCEKCDERFKKKKYLREHKTEIHSY